MKKLLVFAFSFLFTLSSFAQDSPEIWMTYELKAKKGMEEKFEQAAAKKMKKFNNTRLTLKITKYNLKLIKINL